MNQHDGTFAEEALLRGAALERQRQGHVRHGRHRRRLPAQRAGLASSARTSPTSARRCTAIDGKGEFQDVTLGAGMAHNTRFVGWGCAFLDFDNDGWKDLLLVNGHVFPEVERKKLDIHFKDRRIAYRNLGNGKFEDISERAGSGITRSPFVPRNCHRRFR